MCQSCVDSGEITQKVHDAIDAFSEVWPDSNYGPAHIVINDMNVEDEHINWCLENWDKHIPQDLDERLERSDEFRMTKLFLKYLLTWPIEDRIGTKPVDTE